MTDEPLSPSPSLVGEKLRRRYREGLPARIEVLQDALARMPGDEAEEVIRRMAHVLRGSGTSYGYPRITELATLTEEATSKELGGACEALLEELEAVAEPPAEARRASVLVVENDPELRYLLEVVLAGDDRVVLAVDRASTARAVLEARPVDLVILDLVLPDADGRGLLRHVRERPPTAHVPVVLVSGHDAPGVQAECFGLGADAYFRKPFDPDTLAAAVSAHLARASQQQREAHRDPVTGLLSRAGLVAAAASLDDEAPRVLALLELDDFHRVEDRWGWSEGQAALRDVARALQEVASGDGAWIGRWEAETFAVLVSDGADGARATMEAALEALRRRPLVGPDGETYRLTASAGLGVRSGSESLEELLDRARAGVYRARIEGGNRLDGDTGGRGATRRVIVAEDDDITASLLRHRLERDGFQVEWHANGADAYEAALAGHPDLVVLDVRMPGMDGFELLERLRKVPALQGVPIVLLTSMGSEADLVRGFRLGADDYVLKPFSPTEFVARVRRLVSRRA